MNDGFGKHVVASVRRKVDGAVIWSEVVPAVEVSGGIAVKYPSWALSNDYKRSFVELNDTGGHT